MKYIIILLLLLVLVGCSTNPLSTEEFTERPNLYNYAGVLSRDSEFYRLASNPSNLSFWSIPIEKDSNSLVEVWIGTEPFLKIPRQYYVNDSAVVIIDFDIPSELNQPYLISVKYEI